VNTPILDTLRLSRNLRLIPGQRSSTSRRTAGCRPWATPGAACHRLAEVTPADRAHTPGTAILLALQP